METEIVLIIAIESFLDSVVVIQHGCHTVKTKSIDSILFHEEQNLPQQKLNHFPLLVIEALRAPERMGARLARSEVLRLRTIEEIKPISNVGRGVAGCKEHRGATFEPNQ